MLSKLFTITRFLDSRSNNGSNQFLTNQNSSEQQFTSYHLYAQLRRKQQRQQLSLSNPRILLNLCRGVVARLLLILVLIYLYITAYCMSDGNVKFLWLVSFLSLLIVIEGIIAIWCQDGKHEWYWFSPCIFIFIAIGLPAIWFIRYREWAMIKTEDPHVNSSTIPQEFNEINSNESAFTFCHQFTRFLELYSGISFGEHLLTICIVFVRWLLPIQYNEHHNRFVHLEMLLFNVAVVSDIFEFTESILSEFTDRNATNDNLKVASMVSYSISLIIFTINLKAKKKSMSHKLRYVLWSYATIYQRLNIVFDFLTSTESWSCLIVLFNLDLPFLIYRLIILFVYKLHDFKMIFFIVKNIMIILIDIRLIYGYFHEYKLQRSQYDKQEQITI